MPDRNLGSAFFTVYPDTTGFLPELIGKIKPLLASFKPEVKVKVDADTKPAETSFAALIARLKVLGDQAAHLRMDADDKGLQAKLAAFQAKALAASRVIANMEMGADTRKLDAQITKKLAEIAALNQKMSSLQMDANTAKMALKIAQLESQEARFQKQLEDNKADLDTSLVTAKLKDVQAQLAVLDSEARKIQLSANAVSFARAVGVARAELADLQAQARDIRLGGIDPAALLTQEAVVLGLEAGLEKLAEGESKAADGADKVGHSIHNANGLIRGFGIALTATIGGVAVWHIALDAIIEAVISLATATVAAAIGVAALAEAADNITDRFKAMQAVSAALGQEVGPLTGQFNDLSKAMAPQAIELYGGAVNLLSTQTGIMAKTAHDVVNLFTDWTARLDIWSQHQAHAGSILKIGTEYLSQFAELFGQLIILINNLVKADPGIAKFLLDFFIGLTKVLNAVTSVAPELIKFLLVLHGIYLWGSVLVGIMGKMGLYFVNLGKAVWGVVGPMLGLTEASGKMAGSFLGLSAVSWAWIAIAAAALAYIAYEFFQADSATKNFISTLNQSINDMPASQAATAGLAAGIASIRDEMDKTQAKAGDYAIGLGDSFSAAGNDAKSFGKDILAGDLSLHGIMKTSDDASGVINNLFKTFMGGLQIGGVFRTAQNDMSAFRGEIVKLNAEQMVLFRTTGELIKQGYTVSQSFALMDLAGVKAGDSFAIANQKVENLITGYESLSVRGGILANGVDAVTFAALQQDSKVTQLTTAWEAFLKVITGGETTFTTFETQLYAISGAAADTGDKLSLSNGKASLSLKGLETASKGTANSMTGLSLSSLQLRQSFSTGITDAGQLMSSLFTLASAAGQGAHGTDMLTAAGKDAVAQLLPMAKGSKAATTEVYALAQMAGYQGAPSFKALHQWVGTASGSMQEMSKEGGPAKQLDKIVSDLTVDAGNLTEDVKNLSVALGTTLTDAMSAAILQASGGQKAFDDFATSVFKSGTNSKATRDAAIALGDQLIAINGNTADAKKTFETFAIGGLHRTKDEADALWDSIVNKLKPGLNDTVLGAVPNAKKAFRDWADNGLNYGTGKANNLWSQLTTKLGPTLSGMGDLTLPKVKQKFIDWAENALNFSQQQATDLWKELVTLQQHIDALHGKSVVVAMRGDGSYVIRSADVLSQAPGTSAPGSGGTNAISRGAATGLYLHPNQGIPGRDSMLIHAMPGELVVPTNMVHLVQPILGGKIPGFPGAVNYPGTSHLASGGRLPGFAAGGTVPSAYSGNLTPAYIDHMYADFQAKFQGALVKKMKTDLTAAEKAALAGFGNGGDVLAYAESFKGRVPYVWGGKDPRGWDCSGFTSYVYGKFGLIPGYMTSQTQQGWAKPSGPVPGGLVFFGTPAHHVGFVVNGRTMLSALGRQYGTIESSLAGNSGYGIPPKWAAAMQRGSVPGGLGYAAGKGATGSAAAAQAYARSILWAYGWGQGQWPPLQSLWNQESGWNAYAVNPSSGAYGIPQALGHGHPYNLGDYANQVRWGLAYISSRYGSPASAWGHERAFNWYKAGGMVRGLAAGGLIPGLQSGGTVADIRSALAAAQTGEKAKYFGLTHSIMTDMAHAKPGSYTSSHHKTLMNELGTLASRQRAEEAAVKTLSGAGLTTPHLHTLASLSRAESRTALDQALTHQHPGWAKDLRMYLGRLENIGAHGMPPGVDWRGAITMLTAFAGGLQNVSSGPFTTYSYDGGGWLPSGVAGVNKTGTPEQIVPPGGMTPGEAAIIARLDQLIKVMVSAPAAYSQALSGVAGRSASRGYYGMG